MKAPISKNEEYIVTIESITNESSGVCHINGFTVFVPLTAIGDEVKIHIVKVNSSYGFGKVVEVIKPSPTRQEPPCPYFNMCGGCTLQHISYDEQLRIKAQSVKDGLERIGGVTDYTFDGIVGMDTPYHYRNKMIFPFGTEKGVPTLGFYAPRSHRVIPIDDCLICGDVCKAIIKATKEYAIENSVSVYDEQTHKGILRKLFIRQSHTDGSVMVVIVANAKSLPNQDALVSKLLNCSLPCQREGDRVSGGGIPRGFIDSIILNINRDKTNLVLGDKNTVLYGTPVLTDNLCGNTFEISPQSFFQVNPTQTEKLYNIAINYATNKAFPSGEGGCEADGRGTFFDIYCGIGTISLALSKYAKKVYGVEIVDAAIENAKQNAIKNGITNTEFFASPAEELVPKLVESGIRPDVVILDPPRKGSDEQTLGAIVKASPEKIVYVSCNPSTLARDVKFLLSNGYKATNVTAVDMFPHTSHVETVCLLSKLYETKHHVEVKLNLDEMDLTTAESKATYDEVRDYVMAQTGLHVTNLNIAQIKRKCGIIERENYNLPKSEDSRQPKCTKEKEEAIKKAFIHFGMI